MNQPAATLATSRDYSSRGVSSWILRLALVLQCAALALQIGSIQSDGSVWIEQGSWVNTYLVGHAGVSENIVAMIDRVAVYSLWACCAAILIWPCWPVLIPVSTWVLLNTLSQWYWAWYVDAETHGPATLAFTLGLALTEHGLQFLSPLALWLLWPLLPPANEVSAFRKGLGFGLLRIGLAASFASFGFLALGLDPYFKLYAMSLIQNAPETWEITEAHAVLALKIMGGIHLISAAAVLILRLRLVAVWMMMWILATAVIYLLQVPWDQMALWMSALERLALQAVLFASPLALWASWKLEAESAPIPLRSVDSKDSGSRPVPALNTGPGFFSRWALRGTAFAMLLGLAVTLTILMGRGGALDVSQILAQAPIPSAWAEPMIAAATPPPPRPDDPSPATAPTPTHPAPVTQPVVPPPVSTVKPSDPTPTVSPQPAPPAPGPVPTPVVTPKPIPDSAPTAPMPAAKPTPAQTVMAPRLRERPVAGRSPPPPPAPPVIAKTPPPPVRNIPETTEEEPPRRGNSFFGISTDGRPADHSPAPGTLSRDEEQAFFRRINQAAGYVQNGKPDLGEKVLKEVRSELTRRQITHAKLESALDRLEKTIAEQPKGTGN